MQFTNIFFPKNKFKAAQPQDPAGCAALFISDMIPVRQIFSLIHHSSQEALHGASKLGLKA